MRERMSKAGRKSPRAELRSRPRAAGTCVVLVLVPAGHRAGLWTRRLLVTLRTTGQVGASGRVLAGRTQLNPGARCVERPGLRTRADEWQDVLVRPAVTYDLPTVAVQSVKSVDRKLRPGGHHRRI